MVRRSSGQAVGQPHAPIVRWPRAPGAQRLHEATPPGPERRDEGRNARFTRAALPELIGSSYNAPRPMAATRHHLAQQRRALPVALPTRAAGEVQVLAVGQGRAVRVPGGACEGSGLRAKPGMRQGPRLLDPGADGGRRGLAGAAGISARVALTCARARIGADAGEYPGALFHSPSPMPASSRTEGGTSGPAGVGTARKERAFSRRRIGWRGAQGRRLEMRVIGRSAARAQAPRGGLRARRHGRGLAQRLRAALLPVCAEDPPCRDERS